MASNLTAADRAELNRLRAELTAARQIVERLLGDDDPTGLTFSRDDEPPAAPVPPGVDGLSITGRPTRPTNSPAGFASTERRTRQVPGRPGPQRGEAGTPTPVSPARGGAR